MYVSTIYVIIQQFRIVDILQYTILAIS